MSSEGTSDEWCTEREHRELGRREMQGEHMGQRWEKRRAKHNQRLTGRGGLACLWICGSLTRLGAVQTQACWAERQRETW